MQIKHIQVLRIERKINIMSKKKSMLYIHEDIFNNNCKMFKMRGYY